MSLERVDSAEGLESLLAASREGDVWLFKHSLVCGVSSAALREFERFVDRREKDEAGRYAVIEIQRAREISRAAAERLGVRHESPQAILVRDGEVAWHASHWSITARELAAASGVG